ncbi:MAG: thymidylate synthase [Bacilli bacterium]|nr:thymidylate synthase [bacterium]MDD6942083.1 thymidylate synthase [bacterium]MDY2697699.1 thymidylate synthase [Bacilli bacterium]MEE0014794.1 thymidylate synthase [Bacilli bacterium]
MTKGDVYTKEILTRILEEGCLDKNPRPKYADGTPAHTLSVNHGMCTYDLTKGESPLITLRPIAVKSSIGELLWIYQDESNDLNVLRDKYGVTWWDEWDIGNRTIGSVYGETVRRHELVKRLLKGLKEDPDGRRHIICLWQEDDFKEPHGLKPCAFMTEWNVRHGKDGTDYLDMCLIQRSSDFATAGCINQVQYLVFLHLVARHLGLTPGRFSWFYNNIQIYDRHIEQAKELIAREPVECEPKIWLNPEKTNFYDFTIDDIKITGYPRAEIKEKNPQMKFDLGI